jgi:hypothetical protein
VTSPGVEPISYAIFRKSGVSTRASDAERDEHSLAHRYLGPEVGDRYMESATDGRRDDGAMILVRMRPERWLTADYSKEDVGL